MTRTSQGPIIFSETRNKYKAVRCWSSLCQRQFASKAERDRGEDLYMQQKAGKITLLEYQPSFVLCKKPKITYAADFSYYKMGGNEEYVVEDVKSFTITKKRRIVVPRIERETRVKLAWLAQKFGIEVQIVH